MHFYEGISASDVSPAFLEYRNPVSIIVDKFTIGDHNKSQCSNHKRASKEDEKKY